MALKRVRGELGIFIEEKSPDYAIFDFLGYSLEIENSIEKTTYIQEDNKTIGSYWNEVLAIEEGEYIIHCEFNYTYAGQGRSGLCSYPIKEYKYTYQVI